MALFTRNVLSVTLIDGVKRSSVASFYIDDTNASIYLTAIGHAARLASNPGQLATKFAAMSDMVIQSISMALEDFNDPITLPAVTVLRGNKLAFATRAGGRGLTFTIPGRKPAAFTQPAGDLNVSLLTPSAMSDFIAAYNLCVVDQFGNSAVIEEGKVVD